MNEEELHKEIQSNLKYRLAPDEQDQAFAASLEKLRGDYFGKQGQYNADDAAGAGKRGNVILLKQYLKWASGIAAVLLVGFLIWAPWNSNLYEEYAISRNIPGAERGAPAADELVRAIEQYNQKKYAAAKPLFAKAYANRPADAMTGYYYAITLVETGEEAMGREILMALYEGESVFKYDAAFYVALSYVKQESHKEAMVWLEKIPVGTAHFELAEELKGRL